MILNKKKKKMIKKSKIIVFLYITRMRAHKIY